MFCNYCGARLPGEGRFCAGCGRETPLAGGTPAGGRAVRKHMERPREGRKIAGVCAAIANHLEIDPVLVRLLWIVVVLLGGAGILAYIIGWIIIPEEPRPIAAVAAAGRSEPAT